MADKTEFRIGRSHDDIVYHHVAGRDYKSDPRYAVCSSSSEATAIVNALNRYTQEWGLEDETDFVLNCLRW